MATANLVLRMDNGVIRFHTYLSYFIASDRQGSCILTAGVEKPHLAWQFHCPR